MKAIKTLVLAKSIAAALVATAGIAAPTISHASPDDGVVCRAGYSAQISGGAMKCTKTLPERTVSGAFQCLDPLFPGLQGTRNPVTRLDTQGDTSGGRDLCPRAGIVITTNSPLTGLVEGTHYKFATVFQTKIVAVREATERNEQNALGLGLDGVDSRSTSQVKVNANSFGEDIVTAKITLFTLPIAAPNQILPPLQIDPRPLNLPLNLSRL
jgi:hypothetical protein